MKKIINLLLNNRYLKIAASCLVACCVWWHWQEYHIIERTYNVPCCYYNEGNHQVQIPDDLTILLRGKRRDLSMIEENSLALHIDLSEMSKGKHRLIIDNHNLFLPEAIKVVHWKPIHSAIVIS